MDEPATHSPFQVVMDDLQIFKQEVITTLVLPWALLVLQKVEETADLADKAYVRGLDYAERFIDFLDYHGGNREPKP